MNADVAGAVFLIAAATGLVAAHLIHQARTNARHRAVRRQMRAALYDQLIARDCEVCNRPPDANFQGCRPDEAADFELWANELGYELPVIDIEGDW